MSASTPSGSEQPYDPNQSGQPVSGGGPAGSGQPPPGGPPGYYPPGYGQPGYGQPPQGGQPGYGQPAQWTAPGYGAQPGLGQPPQGGQPSYGPPLSAPSPGYGSQPGLGGQPGPASYPGPGQQPPSYPGGPVYGQPGAAGPGVGQQAQFAAVPPGAAAPGGPPRTGSSGGKRALIIVGAAVLALLLIGGTAIALLVNRKPTAGGLGTQTTGSLPSSSSSATAPAATNASDAVKAYLDALATGQVETALALGADQPADKTFLTADVMTQSLKRAPITDINVPAVTDKYSSQVSASYKIGDAAVNTTFYVRKTGDTYRLSDTTRDLNLSYQRSETLPMYINGVKVETDTVTLLPGSYEVTSNNANIDYGSRNILLLKGPEDYPSTTDLKPSLTKAGSAAFGKAIKAALDHCVAQHKLHPTGCPFGVRQTSGQKINTTSIHWRIKDNPLANLKPRLDYQNPVVAEASFTAVFVFSARGTQDGRSATFGPQNVYEFTTASANMSQTPLKVTFD